jgi:hypothetical protein
MPFIDNNIAPGEHIVYRVKFGAARLIYEAIIVCISLFLGSLLGPGIILVILFLIAWLWGERRLQEVAVTNRRLIHKRNSGSSNVKELLLDRIESVKKSGARIIVTGSGGTRIKLPEYIANEADLRAALINGATMPPEAEQIEREEIPQQPLWKRPIPIALFFFFVVLPVIGAITKEPDPDVRRAPQPPKIVESQATPAKKAGQALPSEVMSVTETDTMGTMKRSVVVRLSKPVTEGKLEAIARSVHAEKPNFDRTFIEYLIGDMAYGAGAWATTHFNPHMEVRILGPSRGQLQAAKAKADGKTIGTWVGQMGSVLSIERDGKDLYLVSKHADGSHGREKLRAKKTTLGIRYEPIDDGGMGDHYLLRPDGSLELRDNLGLIFLAPAS